VLISMLLPALTRAQRASRAAVCLSNLHQIGLAFTMYQNTNRGHGFWYPEPGGTTYDRGWHAAMVTFGVKIDQFMCPEVENFVGGPWQPWGSVSLGWGPMDDPRDKGTYGINGWFWAFESGHGSQVIYSGLSDPAYWITFPVHEPTRVPVFADSC